MIAKDIMTRDLITVAPTMTVKQLAMTLIKNQISGAPVAGKNGKLVGIVSENDIIAKKGKDVKAIMSKKIISVGEETSVEEIAQRKVVLLHQAGASAIEDGKSRARHGHRHTSQQETIESFGLRQIRDLGRTADVADRGQHRILNHRTENGVRGK